jgi:hypothetical protein
MVEMDRPAGLYAHRVLLAQWKGRICQLGLSERKARSKEDEEACNDADGGPHFGVRGAFGR